MDKWHILARHKWISNCTITESVLGNSTTRRYTATIYGWRNWKIWQGDIKKIGNDAVVKLVTDKVRNIKERIEQHDESVFAKEQ